MQSEEIVVVARIGAILGEWGVLGIGERNRETKSVNV